MEDQIRWAKHICCKNVNWMLISKHVFLGAYFQTFTSKRLSLDTLPTRLCKDTYLQVIISRHLSLVVSALTFLCDVLTLISRRLSLDIHIHISLDHHLQVLISRSRFLNDYLQTLTSRYLPLDTWLQMLACVSRRLSLDTSWTKR